MIYLFHYSFSVTFWNNKIIVSQNVYLSPQLPFSPKKVVDQEGDIVKKAG